MALPIWLSGFLSFLVIYYAYSSIRSYLRLRRFNGPWSAAWSNFWYIRASLSGKAHIALAEVCSKYGSTARIGPNTLVTCDEELFKKINSIRSGYVKSDYYKAFRFDADRENVLSTTEPEALSYMRKRVTAGYSGKENAHLESDMDRALWSLFKLWKDKYIAPGSNSQRVDLARMMQYLTLDIISTLSLGEPLGFLDKDEDLYEYIQTMTANFPAMTFMSAVPILSRLMRIPSVQRVLAPSVKDRIGMGKLKAVVREKISRRLSGAKEEGRQDMVLSFVKHGLSQGEIEDESMLQILAGSDTTATILRIALIYIISNPRIYRELQRECDAAKVPEDEIITNERALQLPYLMAVIQEALRYHPAASGHGPRIVPPQGDTHDGMYIPPGTVITVCTWKLHRLNYDAYGEDADVFRPERWLEASPERRARMEKAHDLVFGYGSFRCLGERIARIELHKVLFELMRRFDFELLNPMHPLDNDVNYGIFLQSGLWVRVEERKL
ncbi:uncharacterized protein PV07_07512 [Cladophialophora immunda]|uniref:Cytochrome P450 n=1 Tax=Cladophialophora immunda TaxID=569365 RepID=A0A0D2ARR5_9EURO|nr:uncharacterized protein PV07_07512 [Cladophialophora immunda]KIW27807.1 hypothetical protein PV07_07512 [Cladophialophora immunda]